MRLPCIERNRWVIALLLTAACSSPNGGGTGAQDSEIAGQSGTGLGGSAMSSAAGTSALGGSATTGGTSATTGGSGIGGARASGGATTTGGASSNTGGTTTTGGAKGLGGSSTFGGSKTTGGSTGLGGTRASTTGGARSSGGTNATGGSKSTGGFSNTGGSKATGGAGNTGGNNATGGTSGALTGADGCSDTLALGLSLNELAVFQSGKISVMKNGAEVAATTQYGADIIEGRPTLFRAYVTTDSGFQSRQLSARLSLNDGASTYYSKQTIGGSSTELSTTNSFQIQIPAADIKAGLNYSLKIVECGTGSGTAHNPQFPADGQASLATRLTGVIKITVVPVTANNITPTLDQNFQTSLKQVMEAMYPTSAAQVTLNSTPITGCGITPTTADDSATWSSCLDLVRSRRSADRPATDVYYLGVLTPAATLSAYCGGGCVAGISFEATATGASGRSSLAIGFLPQALNTAAHELGHAHGLAHSPGCGASSTDANFPYVVSGKAYIGWVGWDSRTPTTFLNPSTVTDIMAYCTPQWVSDYVYSKW